MMKILQRVVVISFDSHDAIWDKFQPVEGFIMSVFSYRVIKLPGGVFKRVYADDLVDVNESLDLKSNN
jgi:hypothetical protein